MNVFVCVRMFIIGDLKRSTWYRYKIFFLKISFIEEKTVSVKQSEKDQRGSPTRLELGKLASQWEKKVGAAFRLLPQGRGGKGASPDPDPR